jgi:hypothetical protein
VAGGAATIDLETAVCSDHHHDEQAGGRGGEERIADDERLGRKDADSDEEPEGEVGDGESPGAEVGGGLCPAVEKLVFNRRREPDGPKDPAYTAVTRGFGGASHGSPVAASAADAGTWSPI